MNHAWRGMAVLAASTLLTVVLGASLTTGLFATTSLQGSLGVGVLMVLSMLVGYNLVGWVVCTVFGVTKPGYVLATTFGVVGGTLGVVALGALMPGLVLTSLFGTIVLTFVTMMVFWGIGTLAHAWGPQKLFPER